MNVKTPHRLNGTLRSEYEGADLSLSEFNALECDWRVIYQRVMRRAEGVGLYELWSNHPLTVLIEIYQSESSEQNITDWTQRLKTYYGQIAHSTPATEAAKSMVEELNIGVDGVKSHFDYYLSEIERSGDMDPSLCVLLLFVRNYCDVAHKFNRRLEELPKLYRERVLKVEPKGVRPDRGYVVVTPTKEAELFMLRKGCEFKSDDDLTYSLDCDSYVSPIKVVGAHTVFEDDEGVHTAPSLDGSRLFESENPNNTPMEYCWVVASDILNLSGGERRITISGVQGEELKLFTSHEEGWIERELITHNSQLITITVPSEDSALTLCSVDIHDVETLHPALKIISNRAEVTLEDIEIKVEVSGLTTFQLFSEIGEMDSSQPFYPFGALGECGAWFSFGCKEMVGKPLSRVTLSGVWSKMPNENLSSYRAKCSERINNRWREFATLALFSTDDEEAEFTFDLTGARSEGYYQVKLNDPSIGFGSLHYQSLFAETMIYNARHSKRKQKVVPKAPVVPMLSDVMLSYTAEQKGSCQLIRRCETLEYEAIIKNSQLTTNNSLIICLDNANQRYIRLFFDLKFYIKRQLVNCNREIISPHWEWYSVQNSEWQPLGAEQILVDETYDFTRSGAIEFDTSQISSDNRLYLRAVWEGERPRHISLSSIYPNCFGVTAIGGDGTPLEKGSINSLVEDDSRVVAVTQPIDGYGGRAVESPEQTVRRTTTRIATRNRAITPCDYEALLLERFAEIDKVCCIPANRRHSEVRVVLFPKPMAKCLVELPEWKLRRVEEYLRGRITPFARVVAMRPTYEFITVSFVGMLHRGGVDSGDVVKRIRRKIFSFFASWYIKGTHPTLGKEYWHSSLLSRVSNDEAIYRTMILSVEGATEEQVEGEGYYRGATQCSLLIPRLIDIELVEYNAGIGEATIDNNFIIE